MNDPDEAVKWPSTGATPTDGAPGQKLDTDSLTTFAPGYDGFRAERCLVSGQRGDVYQAIDLQQNRRVVLKTGPLSGSPPAAAEREAIRKRLEREASVLAGLEHPAIAKLMKLCENDEVCFLMLGHVEGRPLSDILNKAKRRLTERELRALLIALGEALVYLHRKKILHRDLKPDNIIVDPRGKPTIVDFGSARDLSEGTQTSPDYVTDGYSAPELYGDAENEGPWSDIYSLGAIAYHAITGSVPAPANNGSLRPSAVDAGAGAYSRRFLEAVDGALSFSPGARPQSAGAFLTLLQESDDQSPVDRPAKGLTGERPAVDPYPPTRPVKRRAAPLPVAEPIEVQLQSDGPTKSYRGFLLGFLILLAFAAGAGWFGWPLYQRHFKLTWIVDAAGNGDTTTASEALRLAPEGAAIIVKAGTYTESLSMVRPVAITGETSGDEMPVFAPPDASCLTISAREGSVSGLRFEPRATSAGGSVACLDIEAGGVLVTDNVIQGSDGPAIVVRQGATPRLLGNRISESGGTGILFTAGAGGEAVKNVVEQAGGSGLLLRGGSAVTIVENRIENSAGSGIVVAEGTRGLFEANEILGSGRSGIEVSGGAVPVFQTNIIANSGEAGLFIYGAGGGTYSENQIRENKLAGVIIEDGAAPVIRANVVERNGEHGVIILSGNAAISDNLVRENSGHGIVATTAARLELDGNNLENNKKNPQLLKNAAGRSK
jgi:parallel beta-helix repeat protein